MFLRQKSKRNLDEETSTELLHLIELVRYEIGVICETARISKNDVDLENLLEKDDEKMPKIYQDSSQKNITMTSQKNIKKQDGDVHELFHTKVRDKLKIWYRNKLKRLDTANPTRESKLNLKFKTSEGILNFNPYEKPPGMKYSENVFTDRKHLFKRGKKLDEMISKNSELDKKLDMLYKSDKNKDSYERVQDISKYIMDNF